jgi:hypothetical protein
MSNLKEKIIAVVQENNPTNKKTIIEKTEVKGIVLENSLKKLISEKILIVESRDGEKFYSVAPENTETVSEEEDILVEEGNSSSPSGKKKGKKEKVAARNSDEDIVKEKPSDKKGQIEGGRDMRKFKFNGEQYTKGGLVHAVVAEFVAKHKNIGIAKLKENFPDELIQRFGVFQEISKAKQFASGGRDRYFMQDEKIIKLKDKKIAVCNQWTSENIKLFLSAAKKLGFVIK